MASKKVCKQGREDIIVKVNIQSHIPIESWYKYIYTQHPLLTIQCGAS